MVDKRREPASPPERILRAAADLLQNDGIDAVSTRAVATAAGVQPPTIYRHFGDKDGLLDAVAGYLLQTYVKEKRDLIGASGDDPVADLRRLWDVHVRFGLTHPDGYVLAYGQMRPGRWPPAAQETFELLSQVIARLGEQGRLRMSVERATVYFRSTGTGYILTQIGLPPGERDPELSSIVFEDTIAAITNDGMRKQPAGINMAGHAVALREALRDNENLSLTAAEQGLLAEWLNQLADHAQRGPGS
jgi:AcrR family transcriptional regulator